MNTPVFEHIRKFLAYIRKADMVIMICYIVLFLSMSGVAFGAGQASGNIYVDITTPDNHWVYPIDEDYTFTISQPTGYCTVQIADGYVRVIDSDSPLKICMLMGAKSSPGEWIACLPQNLFITVIGSEGASENDPYSIDASAY